MAASSEAGQLAKIPEGWEVRITADGKVYYVDHVNRQTQWKHPVTGVRHHVGKDLPFGWTKRRDSSGRRMYLDKMTGQTTYTDPRLVRLFGCELPSSQLADGDANHDDLPASVSTHEPQITRRFSSRSTCDDVLAGENLRGHVALITGASSGIGFETARSLAHHGVHVVLACRNMALASSAADFIRAAKDRCRVDVMHLDLSSLASIKTFASAYKQKGWPIHMLICNAAVNGLPYTLSSDGVEMHFAVNHLGHFQLVQLLTPILCCSAPARVVVVSSESHRFHTFSGGSLEMNQVPLPRASYWAFLAYNQSKLCNILFAKELNRRLSSRGIFCNSVHPGTMVYTGLSRHSCCLRFIYSLARPFTKSIAQAAATIVYCAASSEVENVGGEYFADCAILKPTCEAEDEHLAKQLWELSQQLVLGRNFMSP